MGMKYHFVYVSIRPIWADMSSQDSFPYWFLSGWSVYSYKWGVKFLIIYYCVTVSSSLYCFIMLVFYVFRCCCVKCICTLINFLPGLIFPCLLLQSFFYFSLISLMLYNYCYTKFLFVLIYMERFFFILSSFSLCVS